MAAVKRDYYEVLGVSREADEDAIRRAFHALARNWHPDADLPDAEEGFRELAEAYSVLSKREGRLLYDRYGYRGRGTHGFDGALRDLVPPQVRRGENIHLEIEVKSFEAEEGTRRTVSFDAFVRCTACMGRGSVGLPDSGGEACSRCGARGTVPAVRRTRLLIPPGAEDCAQVRVSGDGHDAGAGSVPGDLLVLVRVLPPPKDLRVVRYIAFALLLVAIATLVLYVVR